MVPPLVAGALVTLGLAIGWRGSDLPAQLFRIDAFHRNGWALWDSQWFAGHWLLNYSIAYPALAATIGLNVTTVLSAMTAAVAFDRLAVGHFGPTAGRMASAVFALSLVVETAIGQLPYLAGEAAALWSCVALAHRRPWAAVLAAVVACALSPLAAAFLALAVGGWLLGTWCPSPTAVLAGRSRHRAQPPLRRRPPPGPLAAGLGGAVFRGLRRPGVIPAGVVLLAVAGVLGLIGLLFPGQGPMPYPVIDCLWEVAVAVGLLILMPAAEPALRAGTVLFILAAATSLAVPSALGGNIGRLEDSLALPVAAALLWPARRMVLAVLAVPLVLTQWGPAWNTMTAGAGHPWSTRRYYAPVVSWVTHAGGRAGRLEVVPTAGHWETADVAPVIPLARGWERQLDVADNPLFYGRAELDDSTYLTWLRNEGVRWVALPSAPLDGAGRAEGRLVAAGVPGLRLVLRTANWRIWEVTGASGIVSGPAHLTAMDGGRVSVLVTGPGPVEVRVHDSPGWRVARGSATLSASRDGWIVLHPARRGEVDLTVGLTLGPLSDGGPS